MNVSTAPSRTALLPLGAEVVTSLVAAISRADDTLPERLLRSPKRLAALRWTATTSWHVHR